MDHFQISKKSICEIFILVERIMKFIDSHPAKYKLEYDCK